MNRDDIIRMARDICDVSTDVNGRLEYSLDSYGLEAFAALIAAAERERLEATAWGASQKWIDRAIEGEREACAKVCDDKVAAEYATGKVDHNEMGWTQACAIAIRAREQ